MIVHRVCVLDPGHFHAALSFREPHPGVDEEVCVYAEDGPELRAFLALLEAFNRRPVAPTRWRPRVATGPDPLGRLVAARPGDVAVLAGRNDGKMAAIRRLHAAGFHVLADKPWALGPEALPDLEAALAGDPLVMDIMTGRHDVTAIVTKRLVDEPEVFGGFETPGDGAAAIEMTCLHHLEKQVNGVPLRRPAWFFDVRVQGDGLVDVPTHLVDRVQWLVGGGGAGPAELTLESASRWATPVPPELFTRVTGVAAYPRELRGELRDGVLHLRCNGELRFRAAEVPVRLISTWGLTEPAGGGDRYETVLHGRRARIVVSGERVQVTPRPGVSGVGAALAGAVEGWQAELPGVTVAAAPEGYELRVPDAIRSGHEAHFALVLDEFLRLVDRGERPPARAAELRTRYTLLAWASAFAREREGA